MTWLIYAAFGGMAYLLNGLGAVLPSLQKELHVTRGEVGIYTSFFAAGLLVVGLSGGALVTRIGRVMAMRLALIAMVVGGLLFATGGRVTTLAGDLILGLGAALLIQLVPTLLTALQPWAPTAAIGEANGLASAGSVAAPLIVGASIAAGFGWRWGYLALPLAAVLTALAFLWRAPLPGASGPEASLLPRRAPILGLWGDLVLAVSVEFCMVFWAASAFADWDHATTALAAALASFFLLGMAAARSLAAPITRLIASPRTLIFVSAAVAATGFGLFWLSPGIVGGGAGLAVTGLGVALLYPVTLTRLINAWPQATDRAAARAALGSGVAISLAPFALGALSDSIGLRAAYLIVPVLIVALALRTWLTRKPDAMLTLT